MNDTKHTGLDFGQALDLMREGRPVERAAWRDGGWLEIVNPDPTDPAYAYPPPLPYIALRSVGGLHIKWTPSNLDVLAVDWRVANR